MSIIKVGFSKPKKIKAFSTLIMVGYGIPYSHVYVSFKSSKYDRTLIYQASKTIVNFMGEEVFFQENKIVEDFLVAIPEDRMVALMQFCIDNAGKPYGFKQCLGMAWVRINEIFGRYVQNPFKDKGKTYVCSEMGAHILEQFAGAAIPHDIDDITPKDLFEYLKKIKISVGQAAPHPKLPD